MKTPYLTLKWHYPSSDFSRANYVSGEDVYKEIGHDFGKLVKRNAAFANTCATRVSLALLKSGVAFTGRLKVRGGPYEGRTVEVGAKLLADQLSLPAVFGRPEVLKNPTTAPSALMNETGVVFFWKIRGYGGGHIDLIETINATSLCGSHCYFACREVWFWRLP